MYVMGIYEHIPYFEMVLFIMNALADLKPHLNIALRSDF